MVEDIGADYPVGALAETRVRHGGHPPPSPLDHGEPVRVLDPAANTIAADGVASFCSVARLESTCQIPSRYKRRISTKSSVGAPKRSSSASRPANHAIR